MPLLKGKFRPATKVARSRTNSTSEGERVRSNSFSEFESQKRLPFNSVRTTGNTTLLPSQFSAFKVPASPIIVGLVSPSKQSPAAPTGLFHASPRKTPTTPFSPRRPASPHFIVPPVELDTDPKKLVELEEEKEDERRKEEKEDEKREEKKEEETSVSVSDRLEAIITADKDSSESEYNDSDVQSVASFQGSDYGFSSSRSKKRKVHPLQIDKSKMTIADVIKLRTPKDPENPLTKIWKEIHEKEKRDEEMNLKKEQTRKERIQQLIEEAKANGQELTEKDIDEDELPPIEVQVDATTGEIVVNQKSLEVKMKSETGDIRETVEEDDAEITYGKYEDHKVSINSYSRRKQRKTVQWSEKENNRFYLALRKVGTDFDLMAKIMPEYTRDQLKRKFKREEKTRLPKIDMALSYSMRLDDELLEKAPISPPKQKPKKTAKPTKKEALAAKTAQLNELRRRSQRPKRNVLSDSDEEYPPREQKRKPRPLVIDDSFVMRDESLDRKVVL